MRNTNHLIIQNQVNIVGHSKGWLDARVYLANGNHDVANLIMIWAPNAGSPLAQSSNICMPAVYDLKPGAADTLVKMNPNTKYYTIAGNLNASLGICPISLFSSMEIFNNLPKPNDGLVPVSSVESQGYFHSLGHSKDCQTNLLGDYEYGLARNALLGKKWWFWLNKHRKGGVEIHSLFLSSIHPFIHSFIQISWQQWPVVKVWILQ